jgi:hypothetical protein
LASCPPVILWLEHYHLSNPNAKLIHSLHSTLVDLNDNGKDQIEPISIIESLQYHGWLIDHQQQVLPLSSLPLYFHL